MTTTLVSVSRIIREVIKELDTTDKFEIAREVVARIDPEDYAAAIESLVLDRIPQDFGTMRNSTRTTLKTVDLTNYAGTAQPEPQVFLNDDYVPPLRVNNTKREAIRDAYFNQFIPIGGTVKRLGELTAQDCRIAADVRNSLAEKNAAVAREFSQLAEILESSGKDTLSEVPIADVQAVLRNGLVD